VAGWRNPDSRKELEGKELKERKMMGEFQEGLLVPVPVLVHQRPSYSSGDFIPGYILE
jgi:hypothetical protein